MFEKREAKKLKISIVTPVYNQVEFIEQTIQSVLNQGYNNLEYIVIDGGSTDGTIDIIKKYQKNISYFVSEQDTGMYDALNKGLSRATGDIMGWINSDDLLLPNALETINKVFSDLPEISWLTGLNCFIDYQGLLIYTTRARQFSLHHFLLGEYKWIQQESTFWRKTLWERASGHLNDSLQLAGDFELWFRFFQYENLYHIDVPLGAFRKRVGQLSANKSVYKGEVEKVIAQYKPTKKIKFQLLVVRSLIMVSKIFKYLKVFRHDRVTKFLFKYLGIEKTQVKYSYDQQRFKIGKHQPKIT